MEVWTETLEYYTRYKMEDLKQVVSIVNSNWNDDAAARRESANDNDEMPKVDYAFLPQEGDLEAVFDRAKKSGQRLMGHSIMKQQAVDENKSACSCPCSCSYDAATIKN